MDISIATDLTNWCTQSDWPVHPLILARQFAVCMVICCPVSTQPRFCSSDWLDAHPNLIHRWAQLLSSSYVTYVSHWFRILHTETLFWTFQSTCLTLEISQGHQNISNSSASPNNVSMQDSLVQKITHRNPILDSSKCRCDLEN